MQGRVFGISVLAAMLWLSSITPRAAGPQAEAPASAPAASAAHRATLTQYCLTCHNARVKTAGLSLEPLDLGRMQDDRDMWERVVRKLRVGAMPPHGMKRPDPATTDRLIAFLESELDRAGARSYPGRPVLRRLNRAEYSNAIRDLLGLDVDVTSLLPPDDSAFGFDNVADVQGSSPALLQAYLAAARKISAVAVGDVHAGVGSDTYTVRQDLSQDIHLEGLPFGTVGGMVARHAFPVDGEYDFQIRLYRTNLSAIRGLEDPQELEVLLDGERILAAALGGNADLAALQTNPTTTSDAIEATRLKVRRFVKAGQRDVAAAFLEKTSPAFEAHRLQRFIRDFANPFDAEGAPHVQSITIQGPFNAKGVETPVGAALFVCRPKAAADEEACARRIITTLGRRAFRRPLTAAETANILSFHREGRKAGGFEAGVQFALRRILASPSFVFRPEAEPSSLAAGQAYPVSDLELASRLSFFFWSTIPDETLMRSAEQGRLRQPAELAAQVRRMLKDSKSAAFVGNFAGQWLHLRNLKGKAPNSDLFPDFDDNLRQAFQRETELFFESVVDEDRSVLDLITADYTFVNERLARHYGIPGVFGSEFRRVKLNEDARRGILGKGAVLLVTSHANTTSPVLRGKWVLENIIGAPPPAPPADLDTALKPEPAGQPPSTMREQMERHRANPQCATCHRITDPIGFALENFDAVGAWRTTNEVGRPINTADELTDGTRIANAGDLRAALLKRPDVFVQTLTEKLLTYALGRGLTYQDMPVVRQIVRGARQDGYRFSGLISGIVSSAPFQMRLKAPAAGDRVASGRPSQVALR
jgi:mono/diheme cytochrome c family protein